MQTPVKKIRISKKAKNLIRYIILLGAAIIAGAIFFLDVIGFTAILLGYINTYTLTPLDAVFLCIYGVAFIILASNASRYKPFNLNARRQRHKLSRYISWAKSFDEDAQERIIINLQLSETSSWESQYSSPETPVLNADVASYLEDRLTMLPSVQEFVLHVGGSRKMEDEEKKSFGMALKKYYAGKYVVLSAAQQKTTFSSVWMIIIGIVFLAISFMLLGSGISGTEMQIAQKIFDIIGTVFIWEATYILFVHRLPNIHQRMRYLMLANTEIIFLDEEEQQGELLTT